MELDAEPTVSCLCIASCTLQEITKSIYNFEQQNYKRKELIIVYANNRYKIKGLSIKNLNNDIIFLPVADYEYCCIAYLNNIALSGANGEYFCIWSPIDWHSPKRISAQLNGILTFHKECSLIFQHLILFLESRELYAAPRRPLEKSLMCRVEYFKKNFRFYNGLQECTELVEDLVAKNCIAPISEPTLYIEKGLKESEYGKHLPEIILQYSQKMDGLSCEDASEIISLLPELNDIDIIFKRRIQSSVGLILGLPQNARALSRSV